MVPSLFKESDIHGKIRYTSIVISNTKASGTSRVQVTTVSDHLFEIVLNHAYHISLMTDIAKKVKNATQDAEAKIKTEEDHAKGKPSSETVNKVKVKVRDALT